MANLVIGSNGMSTLAGSSRGLSSPADRARFHQLRQAAEAILALQDRHARPGLVFEEDLMTVRPQHLVDGGVEGA